MTKHPITDFRLECEFGNNEKTHSHLNLKPVMNLEQITYTLTQNALYPQGKSSDKRTSIM